MSNMSYCRFQNTLGDLRDCRDALAEAIENGKPIELSEAEARAMRELVDICREIIEIDEQVDEEGS